MLSFFNVNDGGAPGESFAMADEPSIKANGSAFPTRFACYAMNEASPFASSKRRAA
jgi:hypothetical protein